MGANAFCEHIMMGLACLILILYRKVESIELEPQSTFKIVERLNISVDSKFILDALPGRKSHSECYSPIVGHGYLVIFLETRPSPPIYIFCLNTGQVSCYPWQVRIGFSDNSIRDDQFSSIARHNPPLLAFISRMDPLTT